MMNVTCNPSWRTDGWICAPTIGYGRVTESSRSYWWRCLNKRTFFWALVLKWWGILKSCKKHKNFLREMIFYSKKWDSSALKYYCYLGGICWAANILCLFFSTLGRSAWMSSDTLWLLVGPDLADATGAGCAAGLALAGSGFAAAGTKQKSVYLIKQEFPKMMLVAFP